MNWNAEDGAAGSQASPQSLDLTRTWSESQIEEEQRLDRDARKRQKVTRACDACRSKKKRCTGDIPCAPCIRLRQQCTYNAQYARGAAVPPSPARTPGSVATHPSPAVGRVQPNRPNPTFPSEQSQVAALTAELSEYAAAPVAASLDPSVPPSRRISPEPGAATNVAGQYHGPTSAHSFLGRAWRRFDHGHAQPSIPPQPDTDTAASSTSIFSFGDRMVPDVGGTFSWPHHVLARDLVQRYFEFAAPTYRVLHRATVASWVTQIYEEQQGVQQTLSPKRIPAAAQAVILMIFATASMFSTDMEGNVRDADTEGWKESELYYLTAQQKLSSETGPPKVESIQARFVTVLYLLSSSRANKAWFTHGTMVQLMMAMGLHRKRSTSENKPTDAISKECQKRVLWCAYTMDKYLSLVLGRPRLLQDEDIDQVFPAHVNDEDLTANGAYPKFGKDCVMDAPIFHSRLAQILSRAAKEQYAIHRISDRQQIEASCARGQEVASWHSQLPPFISGAIQASSLIPVFRRQLTVLRLAHFHALMFITRPLLLRDLAKNLPEYTFQYRKQLRICVQAAKDAVDLVLTFVQENQFFPSFWYTQYITFNGLSIIYIYLIQVKKRRIPGDHELNEQSLFELAESGQHHLAQASARNAPAWRYSVILEGLRTEASRAVKTPAGRDVEPPISDTVDGVAREKPSYLQTVVQPTIPDNNGPASTLNGRGPESSELAMCNGTAECMGSLANMDLEMFDVRTENLLGGFADGLDAELNLDFWPQLDSLPLCK